MAVIHKYQLIQADTQLVLMPKDARLLSVQKKGYFICLWAECDPANASTSREIFMVGTGHAVPEAAKNYIGTVQDGGFVWHFYSE